MASAGQAVAAAAANQVPFTGNQIAGLEIMHIAADLGHPAHKFMTYGHRHGNGFLGPLIPVVNVHIRAADRGFVNLYEYIADADLRNGHFFQPEPRLRLGLYQGIHFRSHAYLHLS